MNASLREIAVGLNSLFVGLRITLREFFRANVTVQYPHESLRMTPRYRGHIQLICDPETGRPLCLACKACEKACPSECIIVDGAKREGEKRKSVTLFQLDFTKCSLCGSCVEACHSDALEFSKEYNLAGTSKDAYMFDLVKRAGEGK